jgi:carbohydrate kinase (thermoresistant glucokinase family)
MKSATISNQQSGNVLIIGGVSGAGKSTVGKCLAERIHWRFIEGDDFHSPESIKKISSGNPLSDEDRLPWLLLLKKEVEQCLAANQNTILSCSALKESYRKILQINPQHVQFIFLTGTYELIKERLQKRKMHFMNTSLLPSQLENFEPPVVGHCIDISCSLDDIIELIEEWMFKNWLKEFLKNEETSN